MTNKPHVSKTSLLPSKELVELIEDARRGHLDEVLAFIRSKEEQSQIWSTKSKETPLKQIDISSSTKNS